MSSTVKYASFFVRLWWRRPPHEDAATAEWHGEVEHVQTGMKWQFDNIDDLLAFLSRQFTHPGTWHPGE